VTATALVAELEKALVTAGAADEDEGAAENDVPNAADDDDEAKAAEVPVVAVPLDDEEVLGIVVTHTNDELKVVEKIKPAPTGVGGIGHASSASAPLLLNMLTYI